MSARQLCPQLSCRPTLARLRFMANRLRAGEQINASIVSVEWECSVKTVYRDMDTLRDFFRYDVEWNMAEKTYKLTSAPEPVL